MSDPPYNLSADIGRIVQDAQRAPSIFNTRPWCFQPRPPCHIDLWLRAPAGDMDKARVRDGAARAGAHDGNSRLRAHDRAARARAREYVISCGAALFNLRLAIRAAGHDLVVWPLPDPAYANPIHPPALLASVEIVTGRIKKPRTWEQGLYAAIGQRHTNRRPYAIVPAPLPIIAAMEDAAAQEGAYLRLLHRRQVKRWMRLTAKVDRDPGFNPPFRNHVSPANYGPPPERDFPRIRKENNYPRTRKDFWHGSEERFERKRKVQLMALSTDDDEPVDWLQAGQALQRAILTGTQYSVSAPYGLTARYQAPPRYGVPTRHHFLKHDALAPYGLSASFLTQPLERDDLQGRPRRWPWRWRFAELPQMIMRVGYAAVPSHGELPPKTHMADEWSQPPRQPPQGALPSSDSEFRT